jgi:hypothetical protein
MARGNDLFVALSERTSSPISESGDKASEAQLARAIEGGRRAAWDVALSTSQVSRLSGRRLQQLASD